MYSDCIVNSATISLLLFFPNHCCVCVCCSTLSIPVLLFLLSLPSSFHCSSSSWQESTSKVLNQFLWSCHTTSLLCPIRLIHTQTQRLRLLRPFPSFYLWDRADKWQCCSSASSTSSAQQDVCMCMLLEEEEGKKIVEGHGEMDGGALAGFLTSDWLKGTSCRVMDF